MTRVLSVASECAPLVKTGGLADVVGALPGALKPLGVEVKTLIPGYRSVLAQLGKVKTILRFDDLFGGPGRILQTQAAGLDLLVVDAAHLFDRGGGPYQDEAAFDWPDNAERFAALSYAAARLCAEGAGTWRPDIVHGHDWQAGLIAEYQKEIAQDRAVIPFVFTIHNIAFHGTAPRDRLRSLKLADSRFAPEHFEFWGQISTLKAALTGADHLTTVSKTYAQELMTPEFGMGLEGVLQSRVGALSGLLNGIDTDVWDPATDPALAQTYDARSLKRNDRGR